ncbi:MAG: hypothetical protein LUO88_00380 [Methanoregulaceae archaeon]|jgi:hypothetical protein|nr:hypothetical protein [Methanoregulaceae archaeon]
MEITPGDFEGGEDVDVLAWYPRGITSKVGRLAIRKYGKEYQVYVAWHTPEALRGQEEILYSGSLRDCVARANHLAGTHDTVGDDREESV